jgi:hypothetical protein
MSKHERLPFALRIERMKDEELLRRRSMTLGVIAEISDNLADGSDMPPSSRQELLHSRDKFHRELSAYWLQLTERGIS